MAAKNNQHHLFHQCAASIVNAIRFMLITSSTVDKDSGYIKAHVTLRSHHRGMMASMSKLVLSAQTSNLDPDDAVAKILAESSELLLTVRSFVGTCQDLGIPLVHTDPHWVDDGGRHENNVNNQKFNNRYHLQINLAENLETMGNCIQDSAETIIKCISSYQPNNNRSSSASPTMDQRTSLSTLLFTHFRNLSNQTGLFLGYLDETDFSNVPPSEMTELLHGKQGLSIGLGQLFFKMQAMTDEANDFKKALKQTEEAAGGLYEPIEMICASVLRLARSHQSRSSSNASFLVPMEKRATTTLVNSSMMEDSVIPEEEGDYYDRSSVEGTEFSRDDATFNQSQLTDMSDPIHLPQNAPPPKPRRPSEQIERHAPLFNNTSSQQLPAGGMSISQTASAVRIANHENNSPGGTPPGTRAHTPTPNSNSTKPHSSSKLKRFFGDDAPVAVVGVVKPATVKEELDFLQYDYSPSDIVFNMEGNVKGGTLPALVERLTLHDYLDMNFINTFLLTYRSFCTSNALLDLLEARYNLKCPEGLSEEDSIIWEEKKLKLVRLRVFNVLKNWLELYYNEDDSGLLDRLLMFTSTDIKATLKFSNGQLESLIQKRREDSTSVMNSGLKKMILSLPDPPEPILPRNIKRVKLLDIDPLEMARQLTIIDFKLYSAIRPIECLDKAWSAPEDNVANNIRASIEYCNQVTSWVSDAILSQHDIKKRSVIIKYWVQVAEVITRCIYIYCSIINNFYQTI
jgi:son of sevenless-like protein